MPPGERKRLSRVIEKVTHGSLGGRWKRGSPSGHLRVPGRCAEKRHHDGLVGTQPDDHCYRASALPGDARPLNTGPDEQSRLTRAYLALEANDC